MLIQAIACSNKHISLQILQDSLRNDILTHMHAAGIYLFIYLFMPYSCFKKGRRKQV